MVETTTFPGVRVPGIPDSYLPAGSKAAESVYLPCELCGIPKSDVLFHLPDTFVAHRRGVTFVRCRGCGLISRNPRPWGQDALRDMNPVGSIQGRPGLFRRAAAGWIRRLTGAQVLVVGCGNGKFMRRLARLGFRPSGIDRDPVGVDKEFDNHPAKPPVHRKPVEMLGLADESFHGAVFPDSLGCLPNPSRTLVEIHRLLKTGGTCLVTVPNADSLGFSLFAGRWELLAPAEILFHFNPKTLAVLSEEAGFRIRTKRQAGDPAGWMRILARLLEGPVLARMGSMRVLATPFLWVAAWTAAFGAALAGRGDRIVFVLEKR